MYAVWRGYSHVRSFFARCAVVPKIKWLAKAWATEIRFSPDTDSVVKQPNDFQTIHLLSYFHSDVQNVSGIYPDISLAASGKFRSG
jgi:hypothetical protein